jgi:hypothetical protein
MIPIASPFLNSKLTHAVPSASHKSSPDLQTGVLQAVLRTLKQMYSLLNYSQKLRYCLDSFGMKFLTRRSDNIQNLS